MYAERTMPNCYRIGKRSFIEVCSVKFLIKIVVYELRSVVHVGLTVTFEPSITNPLSTLRPAKTIIVLLKASNMLYDSLCR